MNTFLFTTKRDISSSSRASLKRLLCISVNPANSKHRVYRQNAPDWFSGRQNISWDPDVPELQEDNSVDIHLFFLMVKL